MESKGGKILLLDWMRQFMEQKRQNGLSNTTVITIEKTIAHLIEYKGEKMRLADVDEDFCKGFISYLSTAKSLRSKTNPKTLAKKSAHLYYFYLTTALSEAVRKKYIIANPANNLSREEKKAVRPEKGKDSEVFALPGNNVTVNRILKIWAKNAGIKKDVCFHMSRHTFATMELTLGADLYVVSKLLGHTNVGTTQIYADIINKRRDEAVELIDNAF